MEKNVYVITGATGNVGRKVAEGLLKEGKKVRAVGRSAERLAALKAQGAEAFVGSVEDPADMVRAFAKAKAVFLMVPPHYGAPDFRAYQNRVGLAYEQALKQSGVSHAVTLSSVGAHLSEGVGPIKGLYDLEQRLNGLPGLNVVHLRPAFFMENHLFSVGLIKHQGTNGGALRENVSIPMIATADIAGAAVGLLSALAFEGKSAQELLGPRDWSLPEATRVLGRAVGKSDLAYVVFAYEDTQKALEGMGFSPDGARNMVEMYRGFNQGVIVPTEPRSARNTTPTTLEQFAAVFAEAYRAA